MLVLGIETSCDETSLAIVKNGTKVLSNAIATSKDAFEKAGGVIPEEAAREQVRCVVPVLQRAMDDASCKKEDIDLIAVTAGPGLMGSLITGTTAARTLASVWNVPLVGLHHTLGHLSSTWLCKEGEELDEPNFPCITLSVSGGHSDVWYRSSHTEQKLLGKTRDDAGGEAFDKGAALLGLPYPGGPSIAACAADGDETAFNFPRPLHGDGSCDFSFSGLKTSLRYLLQDLSEEDIENQKPSIAASFQHAICKHLLDRLQNAVQSHPEAKEIHVVGGVSANTHLRELIQKNTDVQLRTPAIIRYCTDNAAMIASAGYFLAKEKPEVVGQEFATSTSKILNLKS